ncbi:hypothetical protein BGAL_0567g00030 [Botrytis galanthina]|uniref:Uncharacterized protein n=1 Tax=Botrytis galanthina TaxID=278940 RepID=A0A4S8QVQ8_9HELO|nr:hypothetical protein BGAL_0567g00030 [Botrytis galanthina]
MAMKTIMKWISERIYGGGDEFEDIKDRIYGGADGFKASEASNKESELELGYDHCKKGIA